VPWPSRVVITPHAGRGGRTTLSYFDSLVLCMSNPDEIYIERASISDAKEILEVQKSAFAGQVRIYDNFQLPPLVQVKSH